MFAPLAGSSTGHSLQRQAAQKNNAALGQHPATPTLTHTPSHQPIEKGTGLSSESPNPLLPEQSSVKLDESDAGHTRYHQDVQREDTVPDNYPATLRYKYPLHHEFDAKSSRHPRPES